MHRLLVVSFEEDSRLDFHKGIEIVTLPNGEVSGLFYFALASFAQRQPFFHQDGRRNISAKKLGAVDEKGIQILLCGDAMINVGHRLVNKLREAALPQEAGEC